MPRGGSLLESPPELPELIPQGFQAVLLYLPMLSGAGAMVFLMVGRGGGPLQYAAGGMFAISMFGMMLGQMGRNSGDRKVKLNNERRDYLRYLGQVRRKVRQAAQQQPDALEWNSPDPASP